ncbi:sensor histidine kinase [Edaphobacter aggregans]|uniref:sensor histidine kinase n=1 Tax=Edaphobacter aggregans TaxID=570835 RepID=UPI00054E9D71|nr:histidine kinase [Edaphobacter aggregans]
MHPFLFITGATSLGLLFALQEWISSRFWNYHVDLSLLMQAWGVQYFIWGVLCWILWWTLRPQINSASIKSMLLFFFPLSLFVCVLEEVIWVVLFPRLPMGRPPMPFWQRLSFHVDAELVDSLVLFWSAFFLFRGVGYYQRYREKERVAIQLKSQLIQAQMRALRMQLNPHFLFNTMNGISSLMRTDIAAADLMLEQLSRLLRITLHRGDAQFIPLSDEMEFIEMYLAMQDRRFAGRVRQEMTVDPHLHDAIVPTMILQPIVENAYAHGLSRLTSAGVLSIEVSSAGSMLRLSVTNSGTGLHLPLSNGNGSSSKGVGLANVKDRLRMHYGDDHTFSISEIGDNRVQVVMTLPLHFAERPTENTTGYGA